MLRATGVGSQALWATGVKFKEPQAWDCKRSHRCGMVLVSGNETPQEGKFTRAHLNAEPQQEGVV